MTPPPSSRYPFYLLLWSLSLIAALLAYTAFQWFQHRYPKDAPTPTSCLRWIGLQIHPLSATTAPTKSTQTASTKPIHLPSPSAPIHVDCLPQEKEAAKAALQKKLREKLTLARLPPNIPLPAHGQMLSIQAAPAVTHGQTHLIAKLAFLPAPQRILLGIPLPLNHASAEELSAIPKLSPRLAKRIIAHRKQHGAFHDLEQLTTIKGIGRKTLERIRKNLTLQAPPPLR